MGRFKLMLLIAMAALALLECRGRGDAARNSTAPTQTIPPAPAQPAPNGNDAMTQTVDIEDSRSVADGGALTESKTTKAPVAAPAKKKKTKK